MNCTIWRSTSMSAPFSASSVNAIVAVVIVCSLQIKVDGSHLNLIRDHDGHPDRDRRRRCGKPLRATPYAPCRIEGLTPLPGTSTGALVDDPPAKELGAPRGRHGTMVSGACPIGS